MVRVLLVTVASLLLAAAGDRCAADVVFTGTVTPGTPGEVDGFTEVTVGPSAFDQALGDPRGSIRVDGGSYFEAGRVLIGNNGFALASMEVTGAQTRVQINDDGSALSIGEQGSGYLSIQDGAWVNVGALGQNAGSMLIGSAQGGFDAPSVGAVEVRGESSLLTVGRELIVGEGASTKLSILDGAVVRVGANFNPGVTIAGHVEVSGDRTELQTSRLAMGFLTQDGATGPAELFIGNGAIVRPFEQELSEATVGVRGTILLDGGTLAMPLVELNGSLRGSGVVSRSATVGASGVVSTNYGEALVFEEDLFSSGAILSDGGSLVIGGDLRGTTAGYLDIVSSEVTVHGNLNNTGSMSIVDSQLTAGDRLLRGENRLSSLFHTVDVLRSRIVLYGSAVSDGDVLLDDSEIILDDASDAQLTIGRYDNSASHLVLVNSEIIGTGAAYEPILNYGTLEARAGENRVSVSVRDPNLTGTLLVGPNASIELTQASFDTVDVSVGGTALFTFSAVIDDLNIALGIPNRSRPNIIANSSWPEEYPAPARIAGDLTVTAEELEPIELGQTFWLIEADRLDGRFDDYTLPELPGTLEFLPVQTDTSLALQVIDTAIELPGDFNADGLVDAADYTLWRDGLPGGQFELDRLVWRKNFGRAFGSVPASVPEPTALAPALIACLAARRLRRAAEVGQVGG